jgi:hypothetical protein
MMGNALYRPDLLIADSGPDGQVPIRPAIIGSISSPETAAEVPEDICRNVGMNASAANMPMPRVKPMAVLLMKIRLLEQAQRDDGILGPAFGHAQTRQRPAAGRRRTSQVSGESQP